VSPPAPVGQRGSGTLLGLGLIAATVTLGGGGVAVTAALAEAHRVQIVANQAALAASDVSSGVVPGFPCEMAGVLIRHAGLVLEHCEIRGSTSRIVASGSWWQMPIKKRALAAPANHPVFQDVG